MWLHVCRKCCFTNMLASVGLRSNGEKNVSMKFRHLFRPNDTKWATGDWKRMKMNGKGCSECGRYRESCTSFLQWKWQVSEHVELISKNGFICCAWIWYNEDCDMSGKHANVNHNVVFRFLLLFRSHPYPYIQLDTWKLVRVRLFMQWNEFVIVIMCIFCLTHLTWRTDRDGVYGILFKVSKSHSISKIFFIRAKNLKVWVRLCVCNIKWILRYEIWKNLHIIMWTWKVVHSRIVTFALHFNLSKCDFIMIIRCCKMLRSLQSYFTTIYWCLHERNASNIILNKMTVGQDKRWLMIRFCVVISCVNNFQKLHWAIASEENGVGHQKTLQMHRLQTIH